MSQEKTILKFPQYFFLKLREDQSGSGITIETHSRLFSVALGAGETSPGVTFLGSRTTITLPSCVPAYDGGISIISAIPAGFELVPGVPQWEPIPAEAQGCRVASSSASTALLRAAASLPPGKGSAASVTSAD